MLQACYDVLIVGCGNIAGGFDMGKHSSKLPCTHAGAYRESKHFNVVACIDPDKDVLKKFMQYWGVDNGFLSIEEFIASGLKIEVISICSPTSLHNEHVLMAIDLKPRLIFCEKPITTLSDNTLSIISACESNNVLLAVNYTRRWDPKIIELKEALASQRYGSLYSIVGYYNKGILNNGSHMIDLLFYLIGELIPIATAKAIIDTEECDPTIPALLSTADGSTVHLVATNANDYALFELQFLTSNGILTMNEGGLSWSERGLIASQRFSGYMTLNEGIRSAGKYNEAMSNAIENLYCTLEGQETLSCSGQDAYKAQQFCESLVSRI